jgi:YVTN family beta-propeller protein
MKIKYILALALLGSASVYANYPQPVPDEAGKVAVANRAAGTVSIIDASTDNVVHTLTLPDTEQAAEPMYVVYKENRIYVGDRANNQVAVYDSYGYNLLTTVPAGQGVFHMWSAKNAQRLLVNNDIDNTVTVIDTNTLTVLNTLSLPADLIKLGFKPHDVFVTDNGRVAFISLVGGPEGNDYVIKLSTTHNKELARQEVGGDPHLFISPQNRKQLYVTSQDSGTVSVLNKGNLSVKDQLRVPNAHGVFAVGRRLYVSNIAEGGATGLYTIDAKNLKVVDVDDTPYAVPHNITVTDNGRKIYVTHSGATQNKVSVYQTIPNIALPSYLGEITVEANPFGLAYIPH